MTFEDLAAKHAPCTCGDGSIHYNSNLNCLANVRPAILDALRELREMCAAMIEKTRNHIIDPGNIYRSITTVDIAAIVRKIGEPT